MRLATFGHALIPSPGGKGISGKIHLESTGRKDHAFNVVDVKIKVRTRPCSPVAHPLTQSPSQIDKFKFAVRDAKHSFLISAFKPLVTGLIKKGIATAIQEGIRSGLVQLDAQLGDLSERYEAAKDADGVNTLDAIKTSYREKKAEAERTAEKAKDKARTYFVTSRSRAVAET